MAASEKQTPFCEKIGFIRETPRRARDLTDGGKNPRNSRAAPRNKTSHKLHTTVHMVREANIGNYTSTKCASLNYDEKHPVTYPHLTEKKRNVPISYNELL